MPSRVRSLQEMFILSATSESDLGVLRICCAAESWFFRRRRHKITRPEVMLKKHRPKIQQVKNSLPELLTLNYSINSPQNKRTTCLRASRRPWMRFCHVRVLRKSKSPTWCISVAAPNNKQVFLFGVLRFQKQQHQEDVSVAQTREKQLGPRVYSSTIKECIVIFRTRTHWTKLQMLVIYNR